MASVKKIASAPEMGIKAKTVSDQPHHPLALLGKYFTSIKRQESHHAIEVVDVILRDGSISSDAVMPAAVWVSALLHLGNLVHARGWLEPVASLRLMEDSQHLDRLLVPVRVAVADCLRL